MLKLSFALPPFFILSLLLMLSLGGCEGSDAVPEMETAPIADEDKIPLWLDGQVEMSPQEWLVKRSRAEVTDERAPDDCQSCSTTGRYVARTSH